MKKYAMPFLLSTTILLSTSVLSKDKATLTLLTYNGAAFQNIAQALADAYEEKHPNITIEVETRPGGGEGDNLVKTKLATNEMADIFFYNSGSMFYALHPEKNLVDLSKENFMTNVDDNFKKVVSVGDETYGVPVYIAAGGGILYNKKIYDNLGLTIPKTWNDFMENNKKIKESGVAPVAQSFQNTSSSQIILLSDFYNVNIQDPQFSKNYTENKDNFSNNKYAIRGFEKMQDLHDSGYLNEDYDSASYDDALDMLMTGKAAHYPDLTFAFTSMLENYPEEYKDIGFFAVPGDDADKNGISVWMSSGYYIPKTSKHIDEAKNFLAFVATKEACDIQIKVAGATGPYMVKDCVLPESNFPALNDFLSYFDGSNKTSPALEFLSPIKGPSLENILIEVGSGIKTAKEGAAAYDIDVRKQAKQLGLEGW